MTIPEVSTRLRLLGFLQKQFGAVSFSAKLTSNQSISHDTWTTVALDEETFSGDGYDTSTYAFTAPYDGKYYFYASALWTIMASTNDSVYLRFLKNAGEASEQEYTVYAEVGSAQVSLTDYTIQGSIILSLNARDTVGVQVKYYNSAAATEAIYGSSDTDKQYTQFFGYKI